MTAWLTATPDMPPLRAVRQAPIVPEWYTDRPTLAPGLMPDTTRSNGSPNSPSRAYSTHSAGGPLSVHTSGTPSTSRRVTTGSNSCSAPTAAPAPENSRSGATITTCPNSVIARASSCKPIESIPSSLVTKIRM